MMSSPNSPFGGMPFRRCQRCGGSLASNMVRCGSCGYSDPSVSVPRNTPMAQPVNAVMGVPRNGLVMWPMGGPGQGMVPPPGPAGQGMVPPGPAGQGMVPPGPVGQGMVPPGPVGQGFGPSSGMYYGGPGQPIGDGNLYIGVSSPQQGYGGPGQPIGDGNLYIGVSSPQQGYGGPGQPIGDGNLYAGVSSPRQGYNVSNPVSGVNKLSVTSGLFMNQERPSVRRIIILVVILLLVMAGSLSVWQFFPRGNANVSTTPMVTPTVVPNATPLFADQFSRGNINGWNAQSVIGKYSVNIQQNALMLENDQNKLLWELVPGTRTFSNFKLFVDAKLTQGDEINGYGIYIRGSANQNSSLATYYRFTLYGDSAFAVFKGGVDAAGKTTDKRIIGYAYHPAIQRGGTPAKGTVATPIDDKGGAVNHISITAKGPTMTFSVNGQTLATITDASYASGSIALFVSNLPEAKPGAQAIFSLLGIYPADAQ